MSEIEKKPLVVGQFAWAVTRKDGKLYVYVGPDPLTEITEDCQPLTSVDMNSSDKFIQVGSMYEAIQEFIKIQSDEYIVIHNPSATFNEEYPNGVYKSKDNEIKDLVIGDKRVITSGHFPLWPRQWIEKRKVHHLSANQYLMVEVQSADVDVNAPYYDLTVKCANIKTAVIDETVATETEQEVKKVADVSEVAKEVEKFEDKVSEGDDKESSSSTIDEKVPSTSSVLELGQRIIISGNLTPVYIPPTGIEIVPDENRYVVCDTVVLGPTEFCIIRNKAGEPEVYEGPGKVFPGPYDIFETNGSRHRVYDAYHIRPDRGILLRIVSDISAEKLSNKLA